MSDPFPLPGEAGPADSEDALGRLEERAAWFEALAGSVDQMIWSTRPDGFHDFYNQRWYDFTGVPEGSTDGEAWNGMFHPDDQDNAWSIWRRCLETGEPYHIEYRLRHRSGAYRWVLGRAQPVRDVSGRVTRWFGTCTDIQEIVEAREILSRSRDEFQRVGEERKRALLLFENIVQSHATPICAFDTEFRLIAFNKAHNDEFVRVNGFPTRIGDVFPDLFLPEQRPVMRALMTRALRGERFTTKEEFGRPELGKPSWELTYAPLHDEAGRIVGAFHHAEDISDRLAAQADFDAVQEALRQSQKMEAVGQLTGGLAHDFNNLLAGISGSLDMMQTRIAQGRAAEIDRYMLGAQGAAKRAAALTHRLLAFSRRQTLDPKPTDMNRLVADMEDLIQRTVGPQVRIETVAKGGLWPTLVDPNQLENALLNLCINARDAMADGGKITIETSNRWLDDRAARERDLPPGQYVSMCVSDNGTGMSPEVMAKAFDPFFTTKPIGMGTGLGLSMIYGFARQSGGQVRIYSELGQGTMVCVYLPRHLVEPAEADPLPRSTEPLPGRSGETVLVIDDEPLVRMLVVDILEDLGYAAREAGDGPTGLETLKSMDRIDLLITDVGLPNGMNGRQVAYAARALRPDLKILFITGYAENAVLNHGHLAHGMQVVTKPFNTEDLARRIRTIIEDDPR